MERDVGFLESNGATFNFNSHAHVERDEYGRAKRGRPQDFNSHAHVERDAPSYRDYRQASISTHTLTWSVTNLIIADYTLSVISTHTLTWSVTN